MLLFAVLLSIASCGAFASPPVAPDAPAGDGWELACDPYVSPTEVGTDQFDLAAGQWEMFTSQRSHPYGGGELYTWSNHTIVSGPLSAIGCSFNFFEDAWDWTRIYVRVYPPGDPDEPSPLELAVADAVIAAETAALQAETVAQLSRGLLVFLGVLTFAAGYGCGVRFA